MSEHVVVIGAGGFGRETLDVIDALCAAGHPIRLDGVVDAAPDQLNLERLAARGVEYLGTEEEWLAAASGDERFVVGIGAPSVRRDISARLSAAGFKAKTLVHPRAVLGSQVTMGEGAVIASGVQISTNVRIGNHVHLNPGCIIGHDSQLADYVSVNPGAIVSGNVVVGEAALLGAGSLILQNLSVGTNALVGAAACATVDVEPATVVIGIPAKPMPREGAL